MTLHIAQISIVSFGVFRASMGFAFGVPVGARSFAALTQVTILVNMESMLVIWGQVLEKTTYLASLKFGLLLKLDNACCLFSRLRLHNAN